nr:MAG TPA: hypothetical protein [Caudoviricetes sp.]
MLGMLPPTYGCGRCFFIYDEGCLPHPMLRSTCNVGMQQLNNEKVRNDIAMCDRTYDVVFCPRTERTKICECIK